MKQADVHSNINIPFSPVKVEGMVAWEANSINNLIKKQLGSPR
jgi:hypothetical protein